MAIAAIGHWDWPTEWPKLIEDLVTCLGANNPLLMAGAMKCLDMFACSDNLSDQHLPQLIPILFPQLLRVFSGVLLPLKRTA